MKQGREMDTDWGMLFCPGGGRKSRERIEASLREHGIGYVPVECDGDGALRRSMDVLVERGLRTIVVVGGDPDLCEAANRVMELDPALRDSIALGVMPNGQSNDFAHYWGYREADIDGTVEWLAMGRVRRIDVGCLSYQDGAGDARCRHFLNCVNIGLVSTILNLRTETRRLLGSRTLSHVASLALVLFHRLDYRMAIRIGTETERRKVMNVTVGNSHGYGLTPHAVPYNGLLDVSVVHPAEMTQLLECICLFLTGKFLNHKAVHPYRTRRVEITESSRALVSVDGKVLPGARGPYTLSVEHEALGFLIPD